MKTAGQLRIQLLDKAAEDEAFRARLLEDPHTTIKEELGVSMPEGLKIKVLEDSADTTNIVLPPKARLGPAELASVSAAGWQNPGFDDDNDRNTNAPKYWDQNAWD